MMELTHDMRRSFAALQRRKEKRPLIGIIGEIFVRHNRFANEDIVRHVEELGGEVWLAPLEEWVYYINQMALRKSMVRLKNSSPSKKIITDIMKTMITTRVQKGIDKKFSAPFEGFLKTVHEPSTKKLLKNAAPYLDDSFEGGGSYSAILGQFHQVSEVVLLEFKHDVAHEVISIEGVSAI